MASISDDDRRKGEEIFVRALGDPAAIGKLRAEVAEAAERRRQRAEVIARQRPEELASELAFVVGVDLRRNAAPGDLAEPFATRRAHHKARWPHVYRAMQVVIRAAQLTRAANAVDPTSPEATKVFERIEQLYRQTFFGFPEAWTQERCARMMLIDAIEEASSLLTRARMFRAVARKRLDLKLTSSELRLLKSTGSRDYTDAVAALAGDAESAKRLASAAPEERVTDLVQHIFTESFPSYAAKLSLHGDKVQAALRVWGTKGGHQTMWPAVARLAKAIGVGADGTSLKSQWSTWRTLRRKNTAFWRGLGVVVQR